MNQPPVMFVLSVEEKRSHLWKRLMERYEYKLQVLRTQNDGDDKDAIATAKLRGQIAQVKEFLALDRERPDFAGTESAAPQ